jgi:hypothetical protein
VYFAWICGRASEAKRVSKDGGRKDGMECLSVSVKCVRERMTDLGRRTGVLVPREIHAVDHGHHAIEREPLRRELSNLNCQCRGKGRAARFDDDPVRVHLFCKDVRTVELRDGQNVPLISRSAVSICPTKVQHLPRISTSQHRTHIGTHIHPFRISDTPAIELCAAKRESTSTSPYSFFRRTTRSVGGTWVRRPRMVDVLPAPRKPVKHVTGIGMVVSRCRGDSVDRGMGR